MLVIHTHTPSHAINIEVCQCVIIAQVCLISTCTNKPSYNILILHGVKCVYIVLILYVVAIDGGFVLTQTNLNMESINYT